MSGKGGAWERVKASAAAHPDRYMFAVLIVTLVFGLSTLSFFPTFAYPNGDEATFISYAQHPWTNISPFFEGFSPKEMQNPYNFRLFLAPLSAVTSVFGFTSYGTRCVQLAWSLLLLWLGYRICKRLGSPVLGFCGMAVLAWSPFFLYFSHAIRPEGMFAMWLLLTTWVMLRPEKPDARTWAAVGFLSSCHLWIHYNGVVMPVIFFLAMLFHDRRALGLRKVLGFVVGGAAFLLLYVPLNILPALETIREYGVMPVTFSSKSTMPIKFEHNPINLFEKFFDYYKGYFGLLEERWWIDPGNTGPFTCLLIPTALWALVGREARRERTVGLIALLLVVAMMTVIPNRRQEYTWYVVPFFFILGIRGFARLPAGYVRTGVAAIVFGIIGLSFAASAVDDVTKFSRRSTRVEECSLALQEIVAQHGGDDALVMGAQEFRIALPGVRFRTFHSMLESRSFPLALARFEPDVVIQHWRMEGLVASYLNHLWYRGITADEFIEKVKSHVTKELEIAGYEPANAIPYRWDDQSVTIWVKSKDPVR